MFAGLLVMLATGSAVDRSIEDLSWLIGDWHFADASTPEAGSVATETGRRRCSFEIDDKYIRCESVGTAGGRSRTYVFYFSYDPFDKRHEMVALHGNWPRTITHVIQASQDGRTLHLLSDPYLDNGRTKRSWGTIRYDGRANYTWETGSFFEVDRDRGPVRFRELARRTAR